MPTLIDDALTAVFWSITYLLIVYAGFRSIKTKRISMPYTVGVLNFAWETCALYWVPDFWGYYAWLAVDFFIVYFGLRFLDSWQKRLIYLLSIVICTVGIFTIFKGFDNGFVYSAFTIDFLIAICYLVERKRLSPVAKIPIAVTKLLGDVFSVFVFHYYTFVVVISILVFICNCIYLYLCIMEKTRPTSQQSRRKGTGIVFTP